MPGSPDRTVWRRPFIFEVWRFPAGTWRENRKPQELGNEVSVPGFPVFHPDGGTASTSYSSSGNTYCSTFTDPAGKPRTPCSNALGQILKVTEAGPYTTTYSYDGFHFYVTQGSSQTRTFTYDSLSRLVSATNPESGTTTYTYPTSNTGPCSGDPSDVCTRTDARELPRLTHTSMR